MADDRDTGILSSFKPGVIFILILTLFSFSTLCLRLKDVSSVSGTASRSTSEQILTGR